MPSVLRVVENLGILLWARETEVIEGFEGDDPRGDGGAEVLAEEGAEGDVFPLLDVAGGPIVEEDQAKDVILRLGRRDALAERFAVEGDEGHFEFEVEQARRTEDGWGRRWGVVWPMGRRMGVPLTTMLEARPW